MDIVEKRRSMLINFIFYALIITAYYLFVEYAFGIVAPFIIAFAIAILLQKPVRAISKKTKIKKSIIAAVAVLLIIAILASLIVLVGYKIVVEFKGLGSYMIGKLNDLPALVQSAESWLIAHLSFLPDSLETTAIDAISDFADKLLITLEGQESSLGKAGFDTSSFDLSIIATPLGGLLSTAKQIPAILTATLISIIACFFLACDYDNFTNMIKKNISEEHEKSLVKTKKLFGDIIGKLVKSYSTIILITFCEVAIGLNILKFIGVYDSGYIVAISIVTAFVDVFPVLGTGTIMIPWAVICLFSGNIGLAIGLLVMYALISVIRQIIEPKLVSMNVGIHPVITLMSMYLGLQIFGVLGIFILPITLFLVKALNDEGIIHLWGRNRN